MSSREEIAQLCASAVDVTRRKYLADLHGYTGRDTILFAVRSPATIAIDDLQGFMAAQHGLKNSKLDLILHGPGGQSEAAEQIVGYLRQRYAEIRVIVPLQAMSAATMIACAADEIVMGKQSALGPVDPQILLNTGQAQTPNQMPAHAVIEEFEKALSEVQANPITANFWVPRLNALPHGLYTSAKAALKRSETLVGQWLQQYMKLSSQVAESAAAWLASKEHLTHGKPLQINELRHHGLNVLQLEKDQNLQDAVLSVFHATMITFDMTRCIKFVENQEGKGFFRIEQAAQK